MTKSAEPQIRRLHRYFVAEVSGVDLREAGEGCLRQLRSALEEHAVLIFRNQPLADDEQVALAERFDGKLHTRSGAAAIGPGRLGNPALSDISNISATGEIAGAEDRQRMNGLANRIWHTDASFVDPAGRFSMLAAKSVPAVSADTEFACMYAAYEALDPDLRREIEGLRVFHSIVHSRQMMGFLYSPEEAAKLKGAIHPLVRTNPVTGRRSLYLGAHASHVEGWPVPEGRLLLAELTEHATQRDFVYRHVWRNDDLVMWDNRATMHRAKRFDDRTHRRELRRVTTLDVAA
jgi:alpha-ketoglutarate-dependent 2,4-dichlorophenoxyacetate dioxygenase